MQLTRAFHYINQWLHRRPLQDSLLTSASSMFLFPSEDLWTLSRGQGRHASLSSFFAVGEKEKGGKREERGGGQQQWAKGCLYQEE